MMDKVSVFVSNESGALTVGLGWYVLAVMDKVLVFVSNKSGVLTVSLGWYVLREDIVA